jgi:shikimate kinase
MPKHVTLIGMMGAGKSSVAPLLAARLGRPVIEVDELIETQEGLPIGEIFIAKGEAHFRRVEGDVITGLIGKPPAVLSLGGGAFMWEATRNLLLRDTFVVYLGATLETLAGRLQGTAATRPLLNVPGADVQTIIRELIGRRGAMYGLAHRRVETDSRTPEEVAAEIGRLREAYD